ncbi:competence type IV pilus major pilin ComGC [Ornithinibacillus sp. 179-J 7C1 HS]|uniref:competence type IV pilus major pilin ComGC n=1 Tax=Ornithinibacillus sp. 179-J 7C1 HS TaxID=3142384 RepID=UPI0039A345EB
MRNYLKKVMKKEKGFTLVELLAVIVILGVILAIAIPSVGNVIKNAQEDSRAASVKLIENAARLADIAGDWDLVDDNDDGVLSVTELKNAGYLEDEPVIPGTDDPYAGTVDKNYVYSGEPTS